MCALRIVVDRQRDWQPYHPSDDVIDAETYLASAATSGSEQVINLCADLGYLGTGYYVSLLAQARGARVIPTVDTLNTLRRKSTTDMQLEGLAPLLEDLGKVAASQQLGDTIDVTIFFGECDAAPLAKIARRLFERLPCPLLEARLTRQGHSYRLARLRPLALSRLKEHEQDTFARALNRHSLKVWRTPRARRRYRFDLAMLVNPEERLPPSNKGALKRFIRAGRRQGINVSLITHRDSARLAEFDGLFLRETTSLDHPTWRMARRAEHEGLVVIDAPQDILRCTNKVYLHELLRTRNVPAPEGLLLRRSSAERLIEQARELSFPRVLKVPDGAFSKGVVKVASAEALAREASILFESSDLLLLQEWLPTDYDWRIGVLDGQPLFASRYYMARGHWQIYDHSGPRTRSGGFTSHPISDVPAAVLRTALKACRLIGNGLYGVDLKQVGERVLVIEVNDNPNIDAGIEDNVLGDALYDRLLDVFARRMEAGKQDP
ncbi:RimK family protein [Halomonas denitrificans]|nr:RimK family protein [Halomonas litopenaei]MBY5931360.1 RimK family protein [Halomonas sp. DP8Y7-3]MBY5970649.1 RimK family protein [Halomonas denitrificans]MBY5986244.1 RimK family protein [Halomonas sp. DP5Y7-2]MBY6030051.1 RimK family protein [Halomonas sp. DP8Y7-1]MBY6209475.1 RimK family protein [Halomonas sp. DP3Y7-2]MBY6230567.1 RimK family protein [Halomonas sp. DP3Y7-1]MED5295235.1 RimK family protein [Pseudomonadota bacterium]